MRTKLTASLIALVAVLALVASPVQAQDSEVEEVEVEEVEIETDDGDGDGLGQVRSAAARARAAARKLEAGNANSELKGLNDQAKESLQAVVDRLGDSRGSGVAAEVLTKLLAGESPSEIGATHGAEMAQAAADRRAERGHGRPDDVGPPADAGQP